ncbi:Sec1 family domain-containing protein 1 [Porphyridium purpureum]|uniref:Sec1 family domain-containing protein 1 n=1 Tax=Porphyridium purpureum TaxID=35688 RepID=A0A5J4YXE1_PORPP|nr:Sec1 family domain-containing protein 1 [Porphyridium purpureum]|eukprot:POR1252..scf209_3
MEDKSTTLMEQLSAYVNQRAALDRSLFVLDDEDALAYVHSSGTDRDPDHQLQQAQVWKVLVYDENGRDILAPLMRLSELRKRGVTLHLFISTKRQPIPDVPAVYFVAPSEENVRRICEDYAAQLYDSMYINFTTSISRPLLEMLAERVAAVKSSSSKIARVLDMHCNFVSLEADLFSLNIRESYKSLNDPHLSDKQVEASLEVVISGLMSVLVTMGTIPVIRAQRGGAAEMVASLLCDRIRENATGRLNLFAEASRRTHATGVDRPILVILDRNVDLPVMLHHTWTYQALAHDVLTLELNRVTVTDRSTSESGTATASSRSFDLDSSDFFWAENAGKPFPKVAEAVESALAAYKRDVEEVNRQAGAVGNLLDEANLNEVAKSNPSATSDLARAIAQLPELRKRKQTIDMHTNLATALLDQIKDRGLDGYFQVEDQIMSSKSVAKEAVFERLNAGKGSLLDKLRLLLIYYILQTEESRAAVDELRASLESKGCTDVTALDYVKSIAAFTAVLKAAPAAPVQPSSLQQKASSQLESVMSSVVQHGVKGLTQVAQNFNKLMIEEDKALAASRMLDALMENKQSELTSDFRYFDPKAPRGQHNRAPIMDSTSGEHARKPFRSAILFVVGGGNYVEYQNIKDHLKPGRSVLYGSTEICNSEQFVRQLGALGASLNPAPKPVPSAGAKPGAAQ